MLGWYDGKNVGVVFFAEADTETGSDELTGELRFAAETVDDPQLTGNEPAAQLHYAAIATDTMYYHRLADFLGYLYLSDENSFLLVGGSSSARIESGLAYSHYSSIGCKDADIFDISVGDAFGMPRVYAHTIPCIAGLCVDSFTRVEIGDDPRAAQAMCMYVVECTEHRRLSGYGVVARSAPGMTA